MTKANMTGQGPGEAGPRAETVATLIISSRNYSSWSLRGWLLTRMSGLPFTERQVDPLDPDVRAELLMRASSIRVPCLIHDGAQLWDTLAIAEYLNELRPRAEMLPRERIARARCRSISGEMHSGFDALRSALPMNLRTRRPNFPVWSAVRADIARIEEIWRECLATWGGPWLFGARRCAADAMYAPVVTRFISYDVKLDAACGAYCETTMAQSDMAEWVAAALAETEDVSELEVEF
jgi:glutathione S-transferase